MSTRHRFAGLARGAARQPPTTFGPQGFQGAQGAQGTQGNQGATGPQGDAGGSNFQALYAWVGPQVFDNSSWESVLSNSFTFTNGTYYRIDWQLELNCQDGPTKLACAQCLIDSTVIGSSCSWDDNADLSADRYQTVSGFYVSNALSGSKDLKLEIRQIGTVSYRARRGRILVTRL